jgi:ABC-type sugar transport system, periplasmic component
VVVINK